GELPLSDYLDAVKLILADETDSNVFAAIIASINYLRRICAAVGKEQYASFSRIASELLKPTLDKLGYESKDGESPQQAELRTSLLSTLGSLGEPSVLARVAELWKSYRADSSSVSASLLPALVEITAANGEAALYDELLAMRSVAATPQEESRFLFALAAFRKPELIERTLADTLNGKIRIQDAPQMLRALFLNPDGGSLSWNFLKKNWAQIVAAFPLQGVIRLCEGITALVNPELEPEIKEFFASHNVKGNEKALAQNLESLSIANRFLQREREQILRILS
ncbi:MAG: ERAP1-like C-terminal domain-containing protein, partial [Candidatus Obscuribacterales bacterium]|nr:ERAP1-like C-terminal domain-containing protein [Candidatus Obscuribacterales bacterium]